MTSSNGNICRVTGHLCRKSPVTGQFLAPSPETRSFGIFFDLRLNKRWVNNLDAGDLRHHCAHYVVTVMDTGSYKTFRPLTPSFTFLNYLVQFSLVFVMAAYKPWRSPRFIDRRLQVRFSHKQKWIMTWNSKQFLQNYEYFSDTQALAIQVMSYKVYMVWIFSVIGLRLPTLVKVFQQTCISKHLVSVHSALVHSINSTLLLSLIFNMLSVFFIPGNLIRSGLLMHCHGGHSILIQRYPICQHVLTRYGSRKIKYFHQWPALGWRHFGEWPLCRKSLNTRAHHQWN